MLVMLLCLYCSLLKLLFLKKTLPVLCHWIRCLWCHLQWNCHLRATATCESEQNCQKEHLLQVHSGCSWRPERCVSSSAHFKKAFTFWKGEKNPLGFCFRGWFMGLWRALKVLRAAVSYLGTADGGPCWAFRLGTEGKFSGGNLCLYRWVTSQWACYWGFPDNPGAIESTGKLEPCWGEWKLSCFWTILAIKFWMFLGLIILLHVQFWCSLLK